MTLLEAARSIVKLKRQGEEWHGPCPDCGGKDRFWIAGGGIAGTGRFACRRCGTSGNAVDFFTQYLGMSKAAARVELGLDAPEDWQRRFWDLGEEVSRYTYEDEIGHALLDVVRFECPPDHPHYRSPDGKTFRPTTPGGSRYKRPSVRRVLYRLPQLIGGVASGHSVYVTEGEKDTDNLLALGLCATSPEGGAGKWYQAYTEALRGSHIVILPDNDEAGERHAEKVASELLGVTASVRVLRLPDLPHHGDVSDWLGAGGEAEDLTRLAEACTPLDTLHDAFHGDVNDPYKNADSTHSGPFHDSRPLSDRETVNEQEGNDAGRVIELWGFEKPEQLRWAVHHFIPHGFVSVLAADGGVGKSFLALYLSVCIALGRPFLGLMTERRRVLYVDYELDERVHKHRLYRVLQGMGLTPGEPGLESHFYYIRPERYLPNGAAEVASVVDGLDIGLVILDSLTLACMGDVTDAQDTTSLMREIRSWGTVLALDHVSGLTARSKGANARPFGSVFKRNLARATFSLAQADGGGFILRPDKNNFAAPQDLVCYKHDFDGDEGAVTFTCLDATADEMVGIHEHMHAHEVTLLAVSTLYADADRGGAPVTAEDVVLWLEEHELPPRKVGTIRNHFTALRAAGRIKPSGSEKGVIPIHDAARVTVNEDTIIGPDGAKKDVHDSRPLKEPGIVNGTRGDGASPSETAEPVYIWTQPQAEGRAE